MILHVSTLSHDKAARAGRKSVWDRFSIYMQHESSCDAVKEVFRQFMLRLKVDEAVYVAAMEKIYAERGRATTLARCKCGLLEGAQTSRFR